MTKRFVVFSFVVFTVGVRWITAPRLLPQSWTPESEIRITARVLEQPSLNDTNYVIRVGRVVAVFRSVQNVKVGDVLELIGRAKPRVIAGRETQVVMYDPTISVLSPDVKDRFSIADDVRILLVRLRERLVSSLQKNLPEPHASLSAGILLGVRASMPSEFYQALVATGTLHVIAASGYNVTIVLRVVMGVLLLWFSRRTGLLVGYLAVAAYVFLAGGSPAVVRAALMGILTYSAFFFGRVADAKRLLWLVAYSMLIVDPYLLVDAGFQLSVAATAGILYFEPYLRKVVTRRVHFMQKVLLEGYLAENLYPTLAATLFTLPIILWWFGRVSWISPVSNMLVLWVVPLIMFLAALVVGVSLVSPLLGRVVSFVLYVPLAYFVRVVEMLG